MKELSYRASLLVLFLVPWGDFIDTGFGTISRLAGIFLGGVWLVSVALQGGFRKGSLFHLAAGGFVLWTAASFFWSIDTAETLAGTFNAVRMLLLTLIFWDLYTRPAQINAALQAFVLGAYCPISSTVFNFAMGIESTWGRYGATGINSNSTAIMIAIAMPIAWHLASSQQPGRWRGLLRLVNYAYLPAAVLAIILTGTRFAIVMSVPTLIFCIATSRRLRLTTRAVVALMLGVALYQVASIAPESSLRRLSTLADEAREGDLNGRRVFWREGIDVWFEHPLLGVGANSFRGAVESGRASHNSFLKILVELGLVGLVLFGAVLLATVSATPRLPWSEKYFWLTVFAVWFLGNLTLDFAHTSTTWSLLALVVAAGNLPPRLHDNTLQNS
jgi:O-antigen ligase